jgi:hypothetical protein
MLSLQIDYSRMRMDTPTLTGNEAMSDICWGGGGLFEVVPVPWASVGITLKGFTNFGNAGRTGSGDLRGYGSLAWKAFRLEFGYRYVACSLSDDDAESQTTRYVLYGPYVALEATLRF